MPSFFICIFHSFIYDGIFHWFLISFSLISSCINPFIHSFIHHISSLNHCWFLYSLLWSFVSSFIQTFSFFDSFIFLFIPMYLFPNSCYIIQLFSLLLSDPICSILLLRCPERPTYDADSKTADPYQCYCNLRSIIPHHISISSYYRFIFIFIPLSWPWIACSPLHSFFFLPLDIHSKAWIK